MLLNNSTDWLSVGESNSSYTRKMLNHIPVTVITGSSKCCTYWTPFMVNFIYGIFLQHMKISTSIPLLTTLVLLEDLGHTTIQELLARWFISFKQNKTIFCD